MDPTNQHSPLSLQAFGKLLALLHDIRRRDQSSCDRCSGPAAECVCGPRVEQCGRCAGTKAECVCLYDGGSSCGECFGECACVPNKQCPCDACVDCSARAISNRRGLRELVDSALNAPPVRPEARPAMLEIVDSLLGAADGRRALRVERVRASIARKMFRRIMKRVCELLEQSHRETDWGRILVQIHDLRDVFVHVRIPAAVIHKDFGRLCAAVCDALVVPDSWLEIPPAQRTQALLALRAGVGRALGTVDLGFLGGWAAQRVREVAGVMGDDELIGMY